MLGVEGRLVQAQAIMFALLDGVPQHMQCVRLLVPSLFGTLRSDDAMAMRTSNEIA